MNSKIEKGKLLLERGGATKEELESVLREIVEDYSTRPRVVIFLDDYNNSRSEIVSQVASMIDDCYSGYGPDFYTECMEERTKFERLQEDLLNYQQELSELEIEEERYKVCSHRYDVVTEEISDLKARIEETKSQIEDLGGYVED